MLKKIGKIVLLVLIFAGGFAVGLATKYYIDEWRAKRNVVLWMDSLDPFKNDTYGGATPEETFDLYLAALKKGDLELASKYFWANKIDSHFIYLQKKDLSLNSYVEQLELMKTKWQPKESNNPSIKLYFYEAVVAKDTKSNFLGKEVTIPAGSYGRTIEFTKLNNIWKIYSL